MNNNILGEENPSPQPFISDFMFDVSDGMERSEAISLYPEVGQEYIDDLMFDIKDGATEDEILSLYPEISGGNIIKEEGEDIGTPEYITKTEEKQIVKEDESFMSGAGDIALTGIKGIGSGLESFGAGVNDLVGGAITATPEIVGNVASGITNVAAASIKYNPLFDGIELVFPGASESTKEGLNQLADQFKADGISTKEDLRRLANLDDDSTMAAIGDSVAKIGVTLTPTPLGKGALITKGKTFIEGLKGGKSIASLLNIGAQGAMLGAKAELATEGEITREGLEEGAVLNLGFAGLGKVASKVVPKKTIDGIKNKITEGVSSLVKVSTGKTSGKAIAKEIGTGVDALSILKQRNPAFKVENSKTALKETLEEIGETKTAVFKEYSNILAKNNVKVTGRELEEEIFKITDDVDFKTLIRNTSKVKGEETIAFDILEKKLKNASSDRSVLDLYDDTKFLQTQLKGLFNQTSSKDALEGIVNLKVLNAYNKVIKNKIGGLKGASFDGLKKEYGALKAFEDSIGRKYKSQLSKSNSGLHNYADAFLDSELVASALRLDAVGFGKAGLTKALRSKFTAEGNPNEILNKIFNQIDEVNNIVSNPLKARLSEKFKEAAKDVTRATIVNKSINND